MLRKNLENLFKRLLPYKLNFSFSSSNLVILTYANCGTFFVNFWIVKNPTENFLIKSLDKLVKIVKTEDSKA